MKLISWNVNGIRAILKRGFTEIVQDLQADILCLQETKARADQVKLDLAGYHQYWHAAEKPGYSGTAIFTRAKPLSVRRGMPPFVDDNEGRVLTAEYADFFLVNVYTPNSKRDLSRLAYRTRVWDAGFLKYLKMLEATKPVVFCGDLNVAHTEIDLANPKENQKNHGFTPEERQGFDNLVAAGFVDTFRVFNKEGGHYTWWVQWGGARERNVGWRIDYFVISASLLPRLREAFILPEAMGSDHCPVGMILA